MAGGLTGVFNTISVALGGEPAPETTTTTSATTQTENACPVRFEPGQPAINTQKTYNSYTVAQPDYMYNGDCYVKLQQVNSEGVAQGFPVRTPSAQVEPKTLLNSFWYMTP